MIYHEGVHICVAKNVLEVPQSISNTFKTSQKDSAGRVSEDVIIQELKKDELDQDTIQNVTDCVIDGQKLRNAKKSVISEDQPFGHSFEAVTMLHAKLSNQDIYYIYCLKGHGPADTANQGWENE